MKDRHHDVFVDRLLPDDRGQGLTDRVLAAAGLVGPGAPPTPQP